MNGQLRTPTSVKVAIVGGGTHGAGTIANAVTRMPGWRVTTIVEPLAQARRTAAVLLPGVQLLSQVDELLGALQLPDLVVIATPPSSTPDVLRALLPSACALLVEKPGAVDADTLEALSARARERVEPVTCAYSYRQHTSVRAFYQQLPRLGELKALTLSFCAPLHVTGWRASQAAGGGALRDLGAHLIDLALQFSPGDWEVRESRLQSRLTEHDDVTCNVRVGQILLTIRAAYHGAPMFRMEAVGSNGRLTTDLWGMVRPSGTATGQLLSRLQTRLLPHFRPSVLLRDSYINALRFAVTGEADKRSGTLPAATLHDATAVLRRITMIENAVS